MTQSNEGPMPDPLAYFLTWATYGAWLPGDERGWVKHNRGYQLPDSTRESKVQARMLEPACILDEEHREIVNRTIATHCGIREWTLFAVNCRSTHVHVVVAADRTPDEVTRQFKAWCTRRLNEWQVRREALEHSRGPFRPPEARRKWWAERGSMRFINDEESLEAAVRYVLEGQDRPH